MLEREKMLKSWKGQLYIIASAILFGTMPFLTKMAYKSGSNAYSVVFWRFLWASIFMAIIIKGFYNKKILLSKDKLIKILGSISCGVPNFIIYFIQLHRLRIGNVIAFYLSYFCYDYYGYSF